MIVQEGQLRFDFSHAVHAEKFDDPQQHGLSHCMKAVDFIVETADRILLVEVKDPQEPQAIQHRDPQIFAQDLKAGRWSEESFVPKCRDTLLYQWGVGGIDFTSPAKPIYYCILVALDTLQPPELQNVTDNLRRMLPLVGPKGKNWQPFVADCIVFNLQTWARYFGEFPIARTP